MPHLVSIQHKNTAAREARFPFNVPAIARTPRLDVSMPVTFFVGENGTGKSTLLEALAAGANAITVGGADIARDETLQPARELAASLRFGWQKKTGRGFFLRAEDFFNFARRMQQTTRELDELISGYEDELKLRPRDAGLQRATGAIKGQRAALVARYGENLDAHSHGESFMQVFESRLAPNGLYLLDEPEAALSPLRQLAFLKLIKEFVAQNCQFIIATHAPILMAFPNATILDFNQAPIAAVAYDELEHVRITRAFLRDPQAFIHRL